MRVLQYFSAVLFMVFLPASYAGDEKYFFKDDWHETNSENFRIVGNMPVKSAVELIEDLEYFRLIVAFLTGVELVKGNPLTVYMAKNEKTYRALVGASSRNTAGLYITDLEKEFSVVRKDGHMTHGISRQESLRQVLFHEYVHHMMRKGTRVHHPYWYDEGLAEYLSTVEYSHDGKFTVGMPSPLRAGSVRMVRIFADKETYEKLKPDARDVLKEVRKSDKKLDDDALYFAGWALTHYLNSNLGNSNKIIKYMDMVSRGEDPVRTFEVVFEVSMEDFAPVFRAYLEQYRWTVYDRIYPGGFPEIKVETKALSVQDLVSEISSILLIRMDHNSLLVLLKSAEKKKLDTNQIKLSLSLSYALDKDFENSKYYYDQVSKSGRETRWGKSVTARLMILHAEADNADRNILYANARNLYLSLVKQYSDEAQYWHGLGQALRGLSGKPEDYIICFERAFVLQSRVPEIYMDYIGSLAEVKNWEGVMELSGQFMLGAPTKEVYEALYELKKHAEERLKS